MRKSLVAAILFCVSGKVYGGQAYNLTITPSSSTLRMAGSILLGGTTAQNAPAPATISLNGATGITVNAQDSNGYSAAFSSTIYLGAGGICYGSGSNCQYGPSSGGGGGPNNSGWQVSGGEVTQQYSTMTVAIADTFSANTETGLYFDGTNLGIGTSSPHGGLTINTNDYYFNMDNQGDIQIGYDAGSPSMPQNSNTLIGYQAGAFLTSGGQDNFLGQAAGEYLVSGQYNDFFGGGNDITAGSYNTVDGHALAQVPIANNCTAIGFQALEGLNGAGVGVDCSDTVGIGYNAAAYYTSISSSVIIGDNALTNVYDYGLNLNNDIIIGYDERPALCDFSISPGSEVCSNVLDIGQVISGNLAIDSVTIAGAFTVGAPEDQSDDDPDQFDAGLSTFSVTNGMVGVAINSPTAELDVSTANFVGPFPGVGLPGYTTTQIGALSAGRGGALLWNVTDGEVCVSTGTGRGAWEIVGNTLLSSCY